MSKKPQLGGHVGSIVDGMQFLPTSYFLYRIIAAFNSKKGQLKVKTGKSGKFSDRAVLIHCNYISLFKLGKNKTEPKPDDIASDLVFLEILQGPPEVSNEKGHVNTFVLRNSVDTYWFECDSEKTMDSWMAFLKEHCKRLTARKRDNIEDSTRKVEEIRSDLPDHVKFPTSVPASKAEATAFTNQMVSVGEKRKKYEPYIQYLNLYAENQVGKMKGYMTWFIETLRPDMVNADEGVMRNWETIIKTSVKAIKDATESAFYKEDFEATIKQLETGLEAIEAYNYHNKSYREETVVKYTEEKGNLYEGIQKLGQFPSSDDNLVAHYQDAVLGAKQGQWAEQWKWEQATSTLTRVKCAAIQQPDAHETIVWKADPSKPSCWINQVYGIVLWNGRSWIWTHPKCPFIIRFNWSETKKAFKQHFQVVKGDRFKLTQTAVAPSLADWVMRGNQMTAVVVGPRDTPPESPPVQMWEVRGSAPPPIMAIVGNFYAIRTIVRIIFGMPL
eukprot:TRINITY_DN9336_c0_g1_i1.p1 TRINITY_DN9336_c0_g1~~TRINITY_DN9336_c0_g1_i1.p1  ORF type:complete len:500 (-),score=178.98 TRINITY_DN9336_c0_g1_i1:50-1549(-)